MILSEVILDMNNSQLLVNELSIEDEQTILTKLKEMIE